MGSGEWGVAGRGADGYSGAMPVQLGRAVVVGALACILLLTSGCPQMSQGPVPGATPHPTLPAPSIEARANPVFRLVVPPRPLDEPARLVAVFVRIENIDDGDLLIRPDRVRLELPDGARRFALDKPRAIEILKRSLLARYDLYYLDDDPPPPRGGLSRQQQEYWTQRFHEDLLDDTRLAPGQSVEGFVIVDTGRRFRTLEDTVVEAIPHPAGPAAGDATRHPVRVLLGAPIEVGP
jgi:hypothetical protein